MGVTDHERARLHGVWRGFAETCLGAAGRPAQADVEALKRRAADATVWISPLEDAADAYALFGLARLAVSFARARGEQCRSLRAPALSAAALLVLGLLPDDSPDRPPAPAGEPPPQLPFRRDIDG